MTKPIGVWFPTVRAGTGADVYTQRLADELNTRGIRAEITWLPPRAEYLPWSVAAPKPPTWATVIHVNSWLPRRFSRFGLPLVVTFHSFIHDSALSRYKSLAQRLYHWAWVRRCERNNARAAAENVAVSFFISGLVGPYFGLPTLKVIPNWVDTDRFKPGQDDRGPHSPLRLVYVGSLKKMKGADLLPKIMSELGSGYELRFTGDESYYESPLPSNMLALGRLEDSHELVAAYQYADVLLFPSRLEGFGLVALEAQACGLPVIASDVAAIPEVVQNGVTGKLCPCDDVGAFASAARELSGNSGTYRDMAQSACRRAREEFSLGSSIDEYIRIYAGLAEHSDTGKAEEGNFTAHRDL